MSDVRREHFFVYVSKDGKEQKFNLIDMAKYWKSHNNDKFWDMYGICWPLELGSADDIISEYNQTLDNKSGLPFISETKSVIGLIDEQIEKVIIILEKGAHSQLEESKVLINSDLLLLDNTLIAIMDKIKVHHPSIVGDWEEPQSHSILEAIKQHKIDKNLYSQDPFFQVRKYRLSLIRSKVILESYMETLLNNQASKNKKSITSILSTLNNVLKHPVISSIIAGVVIIVITVLYIEPWKQEIKNDNEMKSQPGSKSVERAGVI